MGFGRSQEHAPPDEPGDEPRSRLPGRAPRGAGPDGVDRVAPPLSSPLIFAVGAAGAETTTAEITELLGKYAEGDRKALDQLIPILYDELRRVARGQLRRSPRGLTLDTAGLVNEAYLKLARQNVLRAQDRSHFLAITARAMRQVLVNRARARAAAKRGVGGRPVTLDEDLIGVEGEVEWLLDLDRALARLRERDPGLARAFECRFFAGLSEAETAEALGVSLRTAQRQWMRARAWVRAELQLGAGSD